MLSMSSLVVGLELPLTKFPSLIVASRFHHRRFHGCVRWRCRHQRRPKQEGDTTPPDIEETPFDFPIPPMTEPSVDIPDFRPLFPTAGPPVEANTAEPTTEGAKDTSYFSWTSLFSSSKTFPVTFDSGATITISPFREDFVDYAASEGSVLQGLAKGLEIEGTGTVRWAMTLDDGTTTVLEAPAYYVPAARCRLLSPQSYLQHNDATDESFVLRAAKFEFHKQKSKCASIRYSKDNNLPTCQMWNEPKLAPSPTVNHGCVTNLANMNLTTAQKELMKWHYRLCHQGLASIQRLMKTGALGTSPLLRAAAKCELPKCASCEFGKAKRRPTDTSTRTSVQEKEHNLKKENLFPGQRVSMDHFTVTQKGRLYSSRGATHTDSMYSGGCIFVDHATGDIHVEHLVNFTATETIAAKQRYEKRMFDMGVTVQAYQSDNGIFASKAFVNEIEQGLQNIKFSGVGAHHQNGIAERAIGTILTKVRTILIHAAIRWPDAVDTSLWPMAVDYVVYQHNHMPRASAGMMSPLELLLRTKVSRATFADMHVWGCPCYVLEPTLQDGHKLPKWKPRSRRGIFLGFSRRHSSRVPLVLNTRTGHISPQFHVVFDDWFTSVIGSDKDSPFDPNQWLELFANSRYHYAFDEDDPVALADEWMSQYEDNVDRSSQVRQIRFADQRERTPPSSDDGGLSHQRETDPSPTDDTDDTAPLPTDDEAQPDEPTEPAPAAPPPDDATNPTPEPEPPPAPTAPSPTTPLRRSTRQRKAPLRWGYDGSQGAGYQALASFAAFVTDATTSAAYLAYVDSDVESDTFGFRDPIVYQASTKKKTPDLPSYFEAMTGDDREGFVAAMGNEVTELEQKDTWELVRRSIIKAQGRKALPSTWAFRRKRYPDGSIRKLKARLCVRGDQQTHGVDFFETYAPVVQWTTIRLVLLLTLVFNWTTIQTDYSNAFAQATLDEEVYMELPKDFAPPEDGDFVLRLRKSLYGLRQAPLSWYDHLKGHLEQRGFKKSEYDPCLFYDKTKQILCLVYIDDVIWAAPDAERIHKVLDSLKDDLELTIEGDVSAFLGISFERLDDGQIKLQQLGLIDKVLKATGLQSCNPDKTPASQKPLGTDQDGPEFAKQWSYSSVVGMLLYLASNSRPEIAYAVHQCARFTHNPKASHGQAVKRICRYLQGTKDQGMVINPTRELTVDCYVDADFAGQWNVEDSQDPLCVKSRTGFVIMVANCPVHWVSKLQSEIAVSTMEAEYIALSLAMRDLIPLRGLVADIKELFGAKVLPCRTHSKVFEDNNGALLLATTPKMTPRSKHIAVKYHFFKEHVTKGEIQLIKVASEEQIADCLTKGLEKTLFQRARKMLAGW